MRVVQTTGAANSWTSRLTLKEVNSMAKLFCTVHSEKTQKHQTANKELEIKIYYGSREDSKLLAALYVFPTEDVPKFFMKSTVDPTPVTFKPSKKAAEATSDKEDNPTFNRLFPRKPRFFLFLSVEAEIDLEDMEAEEE